MVALTVTIFDQSRTSIFRIVENHRRTVLLLEISRSSNFFSFEILKKKRRYMFSYLSEYLVEVEGRGSRKKRTCRV